MFMKFANVYNDAPTEEDVTTMTHGEEKTSNSVVVMLHVALTIEVKDA